MDKLHRLRIILALGVILVLFVVAAYAITTVRAQGEFATELADRLEAQGVPVKSVVVVSRLPFAVEITLQSASAGETLDVADMQHLNLAEREAALAYRTGTRLDSYKVSLVNASGEMIFGRQGFLYPDDPSQQLPAPAAPLLSDQEMTKSVAEQLGLEQMKDIQVESLAVTRMDTPGGQGQRLDLVVRALDVSRGNESVSRLVDSFKALLPVWDAPTSSLIYGHLQILNPEGKVALNLLLDMETSHESMGLVEVDDLEWLARKYITGPAPIDNLTPAPEAYP